jgi:hypothetical protein
MVRIGIGNVLVPDNHFATCQRYDTETVWIAGVAVIGERSRPEIAS